MNDAEILAAYAEHANPHALRALGLPDAGVAVAARGATVRTSTGRELIDLASGGFGYGHPHVCARVAEQMRTLPLSSRVFFSEPLARFVARLAELAPGDLEVVYPCNSAAEATEGALKLVRGYHRDRRRIFTIAGAHHGATLGALGVCGITALRRLFPSFPVDAAVLPFGDADVVERNVDRWTAAVIFEPVASGSGVRVPPPGYLGTVRSRCTAVGALLIADETSCGLGRTGHRFAVDREAVVPDILIVGGALGGGVLPIAAYVTSREVNDRVYGRRDPVLHGSTTGGNPAACAAAVAALDVIENELLASRAAAGGARLLGALEGWMSQYGPQIVAAAGAGLLAAARLSDARTAQVVRARALAHGALVRLDGLASGEPWIGLRPPLLISPRELDAAIRSLDLAFAEVLGRPIRQRTA